MSENLEAQGVQIKIGDGESPEMFTKIAQVTDFAGPSGTANVIDVTTLDSTAREKLMGLPDEGQLRLGLILSPDDTDGQVATRTARAARTRKNFKMELTDSPATVLTFAGFVLGFELSGAVDDALKATITIEIDGAVTYA